jgi:hypothetical protein
MAYLLSSAAIHIFVYCWSTMPKQKLTIEQVKKISPKTLLKIIQRAKNYLKTNDVWKDMCKEYNVDVNVIDLIPMKFGDLEVSARTSRGVITFSWKLLEGGDFFKNVHYVIHESEHFLGQCYGEHPTQGASDGNYLDNKDEQAGFQRQLEYIDDQFGEQHAEDYVDNLLDHHKVDDEEREEKKDVLMERVDDK